MEKNGLLLKVIYLLVFFFQIDIVQLSLKDLTKVNCLFS